MSVDHMLLRVSPNFLDIPSNQWLEKLTAETVMTLGSQLDVIEQLCSVLGFEHDEHEDQLRLQCWREFQSQDSISSDRQPPLMATICYRYHQHDDNGRVIMYNLLSDPVDCISINRAYPEDFLPVVDVFSDLAPFLIFDPTDGSFTNPEKLFYSLDDWLQKNYEEDVWSFQYK
ncbi:MAG: hypothetical protein SFY66_27040 [Oculatellaceae cyanobacterium bins.114]|nr:hypothetical protein [Oculatellaceae cyanobacterium bins.114]